MTDNSDSVHPIHWSFWVIGGVLLLYNVAGVANFISQLNADTVATMPDAYRLIIEGRPAWATGAFAVAVFGGALGCLLLLLRQPLASYVLIASFCGAAVTLIHTLGNAPFEFAIGNLVQLLVTAFLVWYSKRASSSGWIN
jgi:hypothetical protein